MYGEDGKERSDGKVEIKIDGEEKVKTEVKEGGNGKYTLSYHPERRGEYVIHVLVDGEEIEDSPFKWSNKF